MTQTQTQTTTKHLTFKCIKLKCPEPQTNFPNLARFEVMKDKKPRYKLGIKQRLKLIKKAGGKCENCGIDDPVVLTIHHKDGNPRNDNPDNLQVLCYNCHIRLHRQGGTTKLQEEIKTNKEKENITSVNLALNGPRVPFSVKVDRDLKEAFKKLVKAKGLSCCHIFEGVMAAFLTAKTVEEKPVNRGHIFNVQVDRFVKRVRRYAVEPVESGVRVEQRGSPECCAYGCGRRAVAVHHVWPKPDLCVEYYVCEMHHEMFRFDVDSWRWLE